MPKKTSYLSQLRFDPNLKNTWWARYVTNIRLVILLILTIVGIGLFSYTTIPRRLNPEVKIPIVIVSTVLPGASPLDVEQLVTVPVEDKLNNLTGLDTMTSESSESVSVVSLQFRSTVDGDKALQDVQTALGTVTGLPDDAKDPSAKLIDFEDQPVWEFTVTTGSDTASLMRFAKVLQNRIKDLPKIDRVQLSGFDNQEIQVIINPQKMNAYGINPVVLSQMIKKATASYPAGSIQTSTSTFALSIDKDVVTVEDLRNVRLTTPWGSTVRLADIATVVERSKLNQPHTYVAFASGPTRQAVEFFVYKSKSANIDAAEKDAHKVVDDTIKQYNGQFTVTTVLNTAEQITKQFSDLFGEFQSTIILVFILLIIFLGFRQAVISSLTVPLTFLSTFGIINALGLSLNFLTAFAFLIALGLLIDDTIVTVAAMTRYFRTGKFTAAETGILVWRDFIVPLWSTTITTIWAFVPLLLASGIIGEFIKSIPIVVTATMLSSTTIAVLITLPLMIIILKPKMARRVKILLIVLGALTVIGLGLLIIPPSVIYPVAVLFFFLALFIGFQVRKNLTQSVQTVSSNQKYSRILKKFNEGFINIEWLSDQYKGIIDRVLVSKTARRNTLIFIVVFAVIGYSLVPLGLVKNEFFPKTDEDLFYVSGELPTGTNLVTANKEMVELLTKLNKTEQMNYIVGESGTSISGMGDRSNDPSTFLLTIHLTPKEKRHITSIQISDRLRSQLKTYKGVKLSVVELSSGPPAGADIQVSLLGDDLQTLNRYADKVAAFLKKQPNVSNVATSSKASTSKITFVPNKTKMASANLTSDALGLYLRTYASGFTLDTIKVNNDDTDITFLMGPAVQTPATLGTIQIPTSAGSVQLLSLGTLRLENNPTSIARENGKRRVTITASTTNGASATEKNKDLETFTKTIQLPNGYAWQTGGVNEENAKSVQSILQAMLLSFLLILVTMVIEFGSFRQTLIALLIIPLGVSGVFYIFALTNTPLSFPALIGILALFGIVVTHAIVVIEKINDNLKHNMSLHDSLVDAAANRLEPVLLTSLATIVGLVPITLADPLWRGLGGAIIAGLLFSGAIKLFFVPIVYYNWFKTKEDEKGEVSSKKSKY